MKTLGPGLYGCLVVVTELNSKKGDNVNMFVKEGQLVWSSSVKSIAFLHEGT